MLARKCCQACCIYIYIHLFLYIKHIDCCFDSRPRMASIDVLLAWRVSLATVNHNSAATFSSRLFSVSFIMYPVEFPQCIQPCNSCSTFSSHLFTVSVITYTVGIFKINSAMQFLFLCYIFLSSISFIMYPVEFPQCIQQCNSCASCLSYVFHHIPCRNVCN